MSGLSLSLGLLLGAGTGPTGPYILLSATSIPEDATIGTTVGTASVANGSGSYTWALTADPDNKFDIDPDTGEITTTATLDHEASASHSITIEADNGVDDPVTRTVSISVTNVFERPNLAALGFDDSSFPEDSAKTVNITSATSGSTLSLGTGALPAGMTLDSGARTITGTPTTAGSGSVDIVETLADSANSPRTTTWNWTIEAAGGGGLPTPTLTWTSDETQLNPAFHSTEIDEGDVAAIGISTSSDFSSLYGSDDNAIDAGEAASGSLIFDTPTLLYSTTFYARVRYQRGGEWSAWSNTVSKTMAAEPAPVLSSPTDAASGASGANISVSTDTDNGTLYWYVSESDTPPSATDLKAGTGAVAAGNQAVTATGTQNASPSGLTDETDYFTYFLHRTAAGTDSAIAAADGFTTGAAGGSPFALIAHTSATFGGASGPVTSPGVDSTGGTLIVVPVPYYTGGTGVGVEDNKDNTYTAGPIYDSGAGNPLIRLYYAINPNVGAGHTWTLNGSAAYAVMAPLVFGGPTSITIDDDNSTPGNIADTPEFSGAVTPSQDGALLIAMAANGSIAIDSFEGSPAFTVLENVAPGGAYALAVAYHIQTTAGSINSGWNWAAGAGIAAVALTAFRPS